MYLYIYTSTVNLSPARGSGGQLHVAAPAGSSPKSLGSEDPGCHGDTIGKPWENHRETIGKP